MKKYHLSLTLLTLLTLLLSACNIPKPTDAPPEQAAGTSAAQTVAALAGTNAAGTVIALSTQIALTSQALQPPVQTQEQPSQPGQPTEPVAPSVTSLPSATPLPTATPKPTGVCNMAGFIEETIPDDSDFFPGSVFNKTWTIKNTGTCTWNSSYSVVFTSGTNALNAPAAIQLTTSTVAPGQTVVISMDLTAPANQGNYKAEFKLRTAENVIFGLGEDARPFWVQIDVVTGRYNLAKNVCAAKWTTGAGELDCPSKDGSNSGFVYLDNKPLLEGNYQDDEPAIWTAPQKVNNGYIKGVFPGLKIPAGMKFKATIGCAPGVSDCQVVMTLNYREAGGSMQTLAIWNEVSDGMFRDVSYDLSALAGKIVQIILIVDADGAMVNDKVHWLAPRIEP